MLHKYYVPEVAIWGRGLGQGLWGKVNTLKRNIFQEVRTSLFYNEASTRILNRKALRFFKIPLLWRSGAEVYILAVEKAAVRRVVEAHTVMNHCDKKKQKNKSRVDIAWAKSVKKSRKPGPVRGAGRCPLVEMVVRSGL